MSKSRVDGVTGQWILHNFHYLREISQIMTNFLRVDFPYLRCKRMHYAGEIAQYKARLFAPSVKRWIIEINPGRNWNIILPFYNDTK